MIAFYMFLHTYTHIYAQANIVTHVEYFAWLIQASLYCLMLLVVGVVGLYLIAVVIKPI